MAIRMRKMAKPKRMKRPTMRKVRRKAVAMKKMKMRPRQKMTMRGGY